MKKRIISGFFIVLILAISIIKGGSIFSMVISFCAICGLHEFISIRGKNKKIEGINLISYIALLFIIYSPFTSPEDNLKSITTILVTFYLGF